MAATDPATTKPRQQERILAPKHVGQVAHRQGCHQRRKAAHRNQLAQQALVEAQAQHIKVEQQTVNAQRRTGQNRAGQV
jgi:hypothetical protein